MYKEIPNSPGYYIDPYGNVYNSKYIKLKTFIKSDGYLRISLPSLKHNKRVNFSIHILVADVYLNRDPISTLQVDHVDGNKLNNHYTNLELVTNTVNVNRAHNMGLYTYDLSVTMLDKITKETTVFRSLRELARYLEVSVNYIKVRIPISIRYPVFNKYIFTIDYKHYLEHISKLDNHKKIYVYNHVENIYTTLTSYSQLALLYGISYITIGKKLNKNKDLIIYVGGFSISLKPLDNINRKHITQARRDRNKMWYKLIKDT